MIGQADVDDGTATLTYRKYITIESGEKNLYVKVQKELFGVLKSALLFYLKLRNDLESAPCLANKMVNKSQMTITLHVDYLMISQNNGWEITKVKMDEKLPMSSNGSLKYMKISKSIGVKNINTLTWMDT